MVGTGTGLNNKQDLNMKNVDGLTKIYKKIIISCNNDPHPALLSFVDMDASDATVRISETEDGYPEWYLVDGERPLPEWELSAWSDLKKFFRFEVTMIATISGNAMQLSHEFMRLNFKRISGAPTTLLNKLSPSLDEEIIIVSDGESEGETPKP